MEYCYDPESQSRRLQRNVSRLYRPTETILLTVVARSTADITTQKPRCTPQRRPPRTRYAVRSRSFMGPKAITSSPTAPLPCPRCPRYPGGLSHFLVYFFLHAWIYAVPTANHPAASAAIRHEWAIYYKIERYIVKPNYTLLFFFGHPGNNPAEWHASPYRVGSFYSFKSTLESCTNCTQQQAANTLTSGEVRVTDSLLKGLGSTKLDDVPNVEAWLKDKLTWRILKVKYHFLCETAKIK